MKTTRKAAEQTPRRLILPKEFSKECYLVDFEKEYGKDNGIPERWGIATELTSDVLEQKYGACTGRSVSCAGKKARLSQLPSEMMKSTGNGKPGTMTDSATATEQI